MIIHSGVLVNPSIQYILYYLRLKHCYLYRAFDKLRVNCKNELQNLQLTVMSTFSDLVRLWMNGSMTDSLCQTLRTDCTRTFRLGIMPCRDNDISISSGKALSRSFIYQTLHSLLLPVYDFRSISPDLLPSMIVW